MPTAPHNSALNGTFGVGHRADMKLKNGMNAPGAFSGPIINRGNIGKTGAEPPVPGKSTLRQPLPDSRNGQAHHSPFPPEDPKGLRDL